MAKTKLDYTAWLARALNFAQCVEDLPGAQVYISTTSPLSDSAVEELSDSIGQSIPVSVREFLKNATGSCECRWTFELASELYSLGELAFPQEAVSSPPWYCAGGPLFFNGTDFLRFADTWTRMQDEYPQMADTLSHCLIISALGNDDALALDMEADAEDPPMIYLNHDGESYKMANSFDEFLVRWERLRYIGPEYWVLEPYLNRSIGQLDVDGPNAAHLRQLFDELLAN